VRDTQSKKVIPSNPAFLQTPAASCSSQQLRRRIVRRRAVRRPPLYAVRVPGVALALPAQTGRANSSAAHAGLLQFRTNFVRR
jgi:hypothetical protein